MLKKPFTEHGENMIEHVNRRILILVKTYPSPSSKYIETCCTAGIDDHGNMIRLYPIPYRRMQKEQQYQKWQWIEVDTIKARDDKRQESMKAVFSSIKTLNKITNPSERLNWVLKCPQFPNIEEAKGSPYSLGIIKVDELIELEFQPESLNWTSDQLSKLRQQLEDDLFSNEDIEIEASRQLEKVPYGFYYHFRSGGSKAIQRIRITDWEIYQLYRNTRCQDENVWKGKMILKYIEQFSKQDIYLIVGNQHRFQNQWLCIGVVHLPKGTQAQETMTLF